MKTGIVTICFIGVMMITGCKSLPQDRKAFSPAQSNVATSSVSKSETINNNESAKTYNTPAETEVSGLGEGISREKSSSLRAALNNFPFWTLQPGTDDPSKIYTYVGDYKLTLQRMMISLGEQANQCKKIAAYSGYDVKHPCYDSIAKGLNDFASAIKDNSTPASTKKGALIDATFANVIDFEHAARLISMHNKICAQQDNKGYATIITVSAPCKDFKGAGTN